ncbi:hypothetical protein DOROTHY_77 [Mycobacterium phage Dorothy]|uniref:Helix-turn-helix DNA binding domain protein n=12 Tax=Cheoctovirus TaxID=1623281 RepID=A0A249XQ44_9CAUD|nr:replication initiation protein [Mycobacterium phage Hamulus]YP_008410644.1 replication initiation protein [Mycobacterium phage Daenerys]YP_009125355.1 replication initiation protein [Mycobacterium phage Inventum]YP_009592052.1 replication initiation protein [Mycobacterium phage Dorothy]YP_009608256.1 replication initiation protein [Mycobacterium phage Shauna1]YP_009955994.1 replication initiation protein [Mycobacterium phage DillTech15]YP_009958313.1 replication initiation protein [Mycobac
MPWFYVDDAFADSKPVMQLDSRIRNEAVGLWVRCGAWSAKEETDGHVPLDVVKGFGGTPRLIRALQEQAGLWQKQGCDNTQYKDETTVDTTRQSQPKSREIVFANWEKWQKTKAENEARRRREAKKKSTWRAGKKGRDYVAQDGQVSTGDMVVDTDLLSTGDSMGESRYPDPTRPDPTLIPLVTSSRGVTSVDANVDSPRPECPDHETNSETTNCIPCMKRRKWDKEHPDYFKRLEAEQRRRQAEARQAAIDACSLCDEFGDIEIDDAVKKCDHPNVRKAGSL